MYVARGLNVRFYSLCMCVLLQGGQMTWPSSQPLLLSPWGQSAVASAAASHSSVFTNTMRAWGNSTQPSETSHHNVSRPGVSYTNMSHREAEQK